MPSTTTKIPRTGARSTIVLDPGEFEAVALEPGERSAGGERSEPDERAQRAGGGAQRGAGGTLRGAAPGGRWQRELAPELVDDAVNRARVRTAVGELPGGGRLSDEVIDELLAGASTEEEIVGPGGLLAQLTKRLVERAMEVERTDHLSSYPEFVPGSEGARSRARQPARPAFASFRQRAQALAVDGPRSSSRRLEPSLTRRDGRLLARAAPNAAFPKSDLRVRQNRCHVEAVPCF